MSDLQQQVKAELLARVERKILDDWDRKMYDMRHPFWREELQDYMAKRGIKREEEVME